MRRGGAAAVAAATLVLATSAVLYAHTALLSASPEPGSHLAAAPAELRLVFSEELEASLAQIFIVGTDAQRKKLSVSADPHDVHALVAPLSGLGPDTYHVIWRVVSDDGHPVSGSYTFTVGSPPVAVPAIVKTNIDTIIPPATWGPTAAGAPIVPALLRGLALRALLAFAGLLLFLSWPRGTARAVQPRAMRAATWLSGIAVVLLAGHALAWAINASPEHAASFDALWAALTSGVGRVELWRTGLALVALWALMLARRPGVALVFACAAIVVSGASGHSAAIHSTWAMPAKALHLAAASAWIGGLLWLVVYDKSDAAGFVAESMRVSSVALAGVIVVALSGIAQTVLFVRPLGALLSSAYGAVVIAKVAGLALLVAFGAYHRFRILPRLVGSDAAAGTFTRTLRAEIGVMSLVILLGGFLAYLSPPMPQHSEMSNHTTMP